MHFTVGAPRINTPARDSDYNNYQQKCCCDHRTEYEMWKKTGMRDKALNLLMLRAHAPRKRDDKLQVMLIKKLMKEQNSENHDL